MEGRQVPMKEEANGAAQARSLADRLAAELPDLGPGRLAVWVDDPPQAESLPRHAPESSD
jgi:hypothetical protein